MITITELSKSRRFFERTSLGIKVGISILNYVVIESVDVTNTGNLDLVGARPLRSLPAIMVRRLRVFRRRRGRLWLALVPVPNPPRGALRRRRVGLVRNAAALVAIPVPSRWWTP